MLGPLSHRRATRWSLQQQSGFSHLVEAGQHLQGGASNRPGLRPRGGPPLLPRDLCLLILQPHPRAPTSAGVHASALASTSEGACTAWSGVALPC